MLSKQNLARAYTTAGPFKHPKIRLRYHSFLKLFQGRKIPCISHSVQVHSQAQVGRSFKMLDFREAGNIDPANFPSLKKNCVMFYHPSTKTLAEKVAATSTDIKLGQIDWG
jgi:hypothetical protein